MKIFITQFILGAIILQYVVCDTLYFVQELFRHGARGPLSKYWDYDQQLEAKGELTPAGYRQVYNLGRQLNKEYMVNQQFLSKIYNWKEIYVRSTDVNRTIMSANAQLLGLYPEGFKLPSGLDSKYKLPPYKGADDDSNLGENSLPNNSMVFPVHVKDEMDDLELQPWNRCDDYTVQVANFQKSNKAIIDKFNSDHSAIYTKLSTLLKQEIKNFDQIGGVWGGAYDVFIADLFQKRALPDLTADELEEIRYIDSFSWYFGDMGTDLGVKQLSTPYLNMLINNFEDKINGKTPDLKWKMYSAHDSNVILAVRALNISNYQCLMELWSKKSTTALNCHYRPEFASSLIYELFKKDTPNTYSIKIKYNGEYVKLCEKDSTECDYTEFKQRIKYYVLPDYNVGCKNKVNTDQQQNTNNDESSHSSIIRIQLILFIIVCMLFI